MMFFAVCSSEPSAAYFSGFRRTEMPPCRSRPRTGTFPTASVSAASAIHDDRHAANQVRPVRVHGQLSLGGL